MKKRIVALALLFLLTVMIVSCANSRTGTWSIVGSHTGMVRNISEDGITFSASRANGRFTTNVDLNADNLLVFHVENTNSAGTASMVITQDNTERTFDISGEYNDNLDMSAFEGGRIRIRLVFENAENVNLVINWK
jgi:hypothetical protein